MANADTNRSVLVLCACDRLPLHYQITTRAQTNCSLTLYSLMFKCNGCVFSTIHLKVQTIFEWNTRTSSRYWQCRWGWSFPAILISWVSFHAPTWFKLIVRTSAKCHSNVNQTVSHTFLPATLIKGQIFKQKCSVGWQCGGLLARCRIFCRSGHVVMGGRASGRNPFLCFFGWCVWWTVRKSVPFFCTYACVDVNMGVHLSVCIPIHAMSLYLSAYLYDYVPVHAHRMMNGEIVNIKLIHDHLSFKQECIRRVLEFRNVTARTSCRQRELHTRGHWDQR